jgi:hypothetical protein
VRAISWQRWNYYVGPGRMTLAAMLIGLRWASFYSMLLDSYLCTLLPVKIFATMSITILECWNGIFFNCFCRKLNNNGRNSKISILLVRIKVFWCTFIPKRAFTCPLTLILINYFLVSQRKSPIPKWHAATSEFWWFYFKVDDIIIGHVNAP